MSGTPVQRYGPPCGPTAPECVGPDPKSSRPAWPALAVVDEAVQVTLAHLEELGHLARARLLARRHGRQPRAFHVSEWRGHIELPW